MSQSRRRHDEPLTRDERERLQIVTVAGTATQPDRWTTEHRLLFARDLVEHGQMGKGDTDDR